MTTPVLVLTTTSQRGTVQASVLLDPSPNMAGAAPWSSLQLSNLHSLAQANLISDTQQQIARQLSAQGDLISDTQQQIARQLSAQGDLISDTQQQIARQLSAQGEVEEERGKKEKRATFGVRSVAAQKSSPKIKFAHGE